MPSGVASVHGFYTTQISRLREYAERDHQALRLQQPPVYYWPGDFGQPIEIHNQTTYAGPFDRTELHEDFRDSVRNSAGGSGDYSQVSVQGDFLASMERAFRARHSGVIRCRLHAAGRRYSHGHIGGVYSAGLSAYLTELELESKG